MAASSSSSLLFTSLKKPTSPSSSSSLSWRISLPRLGRRPTTQSFIVMSMDAKPTLHTDAAADHGLNMLQSDASVKAGRWERNKYFGAPLVGKTSSDSKLIQHENVTVTPHLASTMEAQEAALKRQLSATTVNAPMVPAKALRAAAVVLWSALILIFAQPFIASRAYATIQTAANPGGSGVAAVDLGGWFVRTELLSSAWTGFFAGCLHTLSGPDHLAALAPLSIGRSRLESAAVGALWGCGHDAGQVIFGLLFLLLKDRLHIEILRTWGTRVVGLTLLIIGAMGIKEATEVPAPCVALENGECDVDVLNSLENPPKKKIGFATFATGIVHGLQPDALMMVLPALALPSRLAGAAFLGMFLLGTVFSMGSYTVFIGSCSQALKERIPRITEKLTWASSLIAIALGFAILISQFFGYSLY
ncbi:high-affinity nickel-transport family protein [Thalictrum thalictroides]|uniref:High-affinity nickel-transport family protein n=1 Tax=Thalictrum thalictroides TaxID=46969 RepID=A0A7J6WZ74_THATH|nr:high-affinity nickel-transport family protein [Thalictrum thalictroides]